MKHKPKAEGKPKGRRKPTAAEDILDFMVKLSGTFPNEAPFATDGDRCPVVKASEVSSGYSTPATTLSIGMSGDAGAMLICIRNGRRCHHLEIPSRAVAQLLLEKMARVMRLADE